MKSSNTIKAVPTAGRYANLSRLLDCACEFALGGKCSAA